MILMGGSPDKSMGERVGPGAARPRAHPRRQAQRGPAPQGDFDGDDAVHRGARGRSRGGRGRARGRAAASARRRPTRPRQREGCKAAEEDARSRAIEKIKAARPRDGGRRRAHPVHAQRRQRRPSSGRLTEPVRAVSCDRDDATASADAGVVQSRVQLERLVAEDELAGRTIAASRRRRSGCARSISTASRSSGSICAAPTPTRAGSSAPSSSRAICARRSGRARCGIACARRTAI